MPVIENSFADSLIALKSQYERSLTAANTKASHLREQLSHVNALLLNQLLPSNGVVPELIQSAAEVPVVEAIALASAQSLATSPAAEAPASDIPQPNASTRNPKAKAEPQPTPAAGKRSPRPLLPAYRGLTRLEAIAQLLQATSGQDVTAAQVSEGLFGPLSAADHKAERKSLNTQLYKGQSQKLWQKGTAPGTFTIGAPTPHESVQPAPISNAPATKAKAQATTSAKRKSLTLLPAYAELSKGEAIAQVLAAASGEVLHHDTIIQTLYGDLSPEELKKERVRIKTALFAGVKDGKWRKASVPSSYFLETPAAGTKPKRPGRKPDPSQEPKPEPVAEVAPASAKAKVVKQKPGRKPAIANAKASQKKARSKRTELELVALLRKADIQI
jgi:hypothetical protein